MPEDSSAKRKKGHIEREVGKKRRSEKEETRGKDEEQRAIEMGKERGELKR